MSIMVAELYDALIDGLAALVIDAFFK